MEFFLLDREPYPMKVILAFGPWDTHEMRDFLLDHNLGEISEATEECGESSAGMQGKTNHGHILVHCSIYPSTARTYEVLMHELFHATLAYGIELGIEPCPDSEEFFSYFHGQLCSDVFYILWNLPEDYWPKGLACNTDGFPLEEEAMANTRRKIVVLLDRNDLRNQGLTLNSIHDAQVSGNRATPMVAGKRLNNLLRGQWRFATAEEVAKEAAGNRKLAPKDAPEVGDGTVSPDGDNLDAGPNADQPPVVNLLPNGETETVPPSGPQGEDGPDDSGLTGPIGEIGDPGPKGEPGILPSQPEPQPEVSQPPVGNGEPEFNPEDAPPSEPEVTGEQTGEPVEGEPEPQPEPEAQAEPEAQPGPEAQPVVEAPTPTEEAAPAPSEDAPSDDAAEQQSPE